MRSRRRAGERDLFILTIRGKKRERCKVLSRAVAWPGGRGKSSAVMETSRESRAGNQRLPKARRAPQLQRPPNTCRTPCLWRPRHPNGLLNYHNSPALCCGVLLPVVVAGVWLRSGWLLRSLCRLTQELKDH